MEFSVRSATLGDFERVAHLNEIVQSLHGEHHPDRFLESDPAGVAAWLHRCASDSESMGLFVAESPEKIIGYVLGFLRERPQSPFSPARRWCELDQIAVRAEWRGQGVARALVEALDRWARKRQCPEMELEVWDFNEEAAASFARLGFRSLRRRMRRGEKKEGDDD
jgi:GNAT superfamily N-acetyltransferase